MDWFDLVGVFEELVEVFSSSNSLALIQSFMLFFILECRGGEEVGYYFMHKSVTGESHVVAH